MESPPARGHDAALLQRQLRSPTGEQLHRRRVSRTIQSEDSFFTPGTSPQAFSASHTRFDAFNGAETPNSVGQRQNGPSAMSRTQKMNFSTHHNHHGHNCGGSPHMNSHMSPQMNAHMSPQMNPHTAPYSSQHTGPHSSVNTNVNTGPHNSVNTGVHTGTTGVPTTAPHARTATAGVQSPPLSVPSALRPTQRSQPASPTRNTTSTPARALGSRRRCAKCDGDISGHFVRALGAAYHIECFTCIDCGVQCASKFFPVDGQPLCEHCYFKRQNLLCYRCGKSLRGSYITALDRKYHVEHFTCSLCTTVFGPNDSYFEYNGDVYCRAHYSSLFAFHCEGCKSPILKQFVETYRGGKKQQWHPECYMIFKFWNVKISDPKAKEIDELRAKLAANSDPNKPLDPSAAEIIAHEEMVDRRTMRTWTTLCGYEEVTAAEISNLVQQAVNGDFRGAYSACCRLVALIKVLFTALDMIPANGSSGNANTSASDESPREPGREAKTLCRKIVSAMSLLSKTRDLAPRERMQGLARDLLALASAMAHYLKVIIRQSLSAALATETLDEYLVSVGQYAQAKPAKLVSPFSRDQCLACGKAVEHKCYRQRGRSDRLWHARPECFKCTRTNVPLTPETATVDEKGRLIARSVAGPNAPPYAEFTEVSKLEQYVILLHVALARLDLVLTNNNAKSQSQHNSPSPVDHQSPAVSASTPTLPRRIENFGGANGSGGATTSSPKFAFGTSPTALERTSMILHEKAGLTLDDIRRIVASQQAKVTAEMANSSTNTAATATATTAPQPRTSESRKRSIGSSGQYFGTLTDDEYVWTRNIAQALLQSFSQKYLRKDLDAVITSSKTPTLWGRMGKVFTKEQEGRRVFGQPLERLVSKYGVDSNLVALDSAEAGEFPRYSLRIPGFVDDCITAMRQKDMSAEGVFRKNGNIRRIREFVEQIDRNPEETGLLVDETPIQLAALLKRFLRDLPDPLLCAKLSPLWTLMPKLNPEEGIKLAQLLVAALPRPNRALLEVLAAFLNWVSSFAHVDDETGSKMDIQNLATVLGPTLVLSNEEAEAAAGQAPAAADPTSPFKYVSEPVKFLITDFRLIAEVPEDIVRCLNQVRRTPPRRLSSQEAQELLKQAPPPPPQSA